MSPELPKLNIANKKITTEIALSPEKGTMVNSQNYITFKHVYNDNKSYQNRDSLESSYNAAEISKHFVMAKEIKGVPNNYYNYLVFENIQDALAHVQEAPEDNRSFHEVIFGWMPQKLKFDIDIKLTAGIDLIVDDVLITPDKVSEIIDDAISTAFYITWSLPVSSDQIITTYSHGPTKISFHKVIFGYYVEDAEQAREFTKIFMRNLPPQYHDWVDTSVNKNLQNFRIINSAKLDTNRVKRLPIGTIYTPSQTLITNIDGCVLLRNIIEVAAQTNHNNGTLDANDLDTILEIVTNSGLTNSHRYQSMSGRLLIYRRVCASYCDLCKRVHDNENSLMISVEITDGIGKVYENCRRCNITPSSKLLGTFYSTAIDTDIPLDDKRVLNRHTMLTERIAKGLENPVALPDRIAINNIPPNMSNIYSEPALRPFEHVDTLCVIAGMKMGKTKELMKYISTNFSSTDIYKPKIIFVSFRQTFSANIKDKFPDFTIYSDVKDPILRQRKLIVQVESMHRIDVSINTPLPDLVVLDEVELILEQFDSGLLKQFNKSWATFQWLMENSKHVVCLDAAMSDRTINVLKKNAY